MGGVAKTTGEGAGQRREGWWVLARGQDCLCVFLDFQEHRADMKVRSVTTVSDLTLFEPWAASRLQGLPYIAC